ncbi:6839_t:CDS:2, partial [Funneliformis geosporum]
FGNGLSALLPIVMYGDELDIRAFESSVCIISSKLANLTMYPLEFFALVIIFYLWHALVKRSIDIEKKTFVYFSGTIWMYTIVYNIYEMFRLRQQKNWGVRTSFFNCITTHSVRNYYGYVIPISILSFIAIIMTCHSTIILYERWRNFNCNMNRTTAIKLGHAVRLHILCISIIVLTLLNLIPRIFYLETTVSYFAAALVKAALFLPFCYYVPPDRSGNELLQADQEEYNFNV